MLNNGLKDARETSRVIARELCAAGLADVEEIGRGGFGVVYRGIQLQLDREVAIKVLTADTDRNRVRFMREQQAVGRLTGHPNIVAVLQVGETESARPYLVMPYYRRGCTQTRIRQLGILPADEVLRLGVKIAGAVESAHRAGIVHRDVKPANILITDYDEPALSDFGIAHMSRDSEVANAYTGTPSFQAPELLSGELPTPAADVYALGATLYCALTGRTAFERRAGEQLSAWQLRRIATERTPTRREHLVADDISTLVEQAMSHDPHDRPSAQELGEELRLLQSRHGLAVDEMALGGAGRCRRVSTESAIPASTLRTGRRLPAPLASFVGRQAELSQLRTLLSTSRLVTLSGFGGVGKSALAMHAAGELLRYFADGVWHIELGDLHDDSLLADIVAAALDVHDDIGRPQMGSLVDFLREREALVVLDNCEHIIDAVARLVLTLLRSCPRLRILTASREILRVPGETPLLLPPLTYPDQTQTRDLRSLTGYDAVALFVERARSAVPGFVLTEHNAADVVRICASLEGLPLALEVAAARLRVMSAEQIVAGMSDRYGWLTHSRRGAAPRQQTLASCVQWSYELCTDIERQLWGQLSIFTGSFELVAAQYVCDAGIGPEEFLDVISSLVAKSVLLRTEDAGAVRFRLPQTFRDYARTRISGSSESHLQRRRHTQWYHKLVVAASTRWFGSDQLRWIRRITGELPDIRDALQASLSDSPATALELAVAMCGIWFNCSMLDEGRRWLEMALAAAPEPTEPRLRALCAVALLANLKVDVTAAQARTEEARRLLTALGDPSAAALIEGLDGYAGWLVGDLSNARDCFRRALNTADNPELRTACMVMMGGLAELSGNLHRAMCWYEKALRLAESRGETIWRSKILLSLGRSHFRQGHQREARQLLVESLQLCHTFMDSVIGGQCLEMLGWCAVSDKKPRRATVLMAAATALTRNTSVAMRPFTQFGGSHPECKHRARKELGAIEFDAAWSEGAALTFDEAVGIALTEFDCGESSDLSGNERAPFVGGA